MRSAPVTIVTDDRAFAGLLIGWAQAAGLAVSWDGNNALPVTIVCERADVRRRLLAIARVKIGELARYPSFERLSAAFRELRMDE